MFFDSRFAVALTWLAAALTSPVLAQSDKPLRLVVPFAPGGAQDVIGRTLADRLAPRLGQTVLIDNRAGAGGVIAADAVAKAAPDGNTLLLATGGAITIAPHLHAKLPYVPRRDLAAVALIADTPMTLAVRAQSAYRSVGEVLRDAAARPRQVAYASTGNATVSHLTGELFAQAAGVQLLHVPYKGAAPAITDLIGGQVALIVTSAASIDGMVEAGKARVLATFTAARMPSLGNPPVIAEAAGMKGLEVPVWVGIMAPAATPVERLERLATELVAVCRASETADRFKGLGALQSCGGRAELARTVDEDHARWERVIRQGGIRVE
ncbi:MAG: tripartite tricarboxylate transporter substrate binding protein [Burkholderiales bacterium]|nr:tripartite tricarboxylate transporter substrate binding protein [Burkholderiales bacterium]